MSLSASRLGQLVKLTGEQMNVLLKEEGFLEGEPGNYSPTDKGMKYVIEKGADNGYGGYAFRGWNWLEWDPSILDAIKITPERIKEIAEKTAEQRLARRVAKSAASEAYWNSINASKQVTNVMDSDRTTGGGILVTVIGSLAILVASAGLSIYLNRKASKEKNDE